MSLQLRDIALMFMQKNTCPQVTLSKHRIRIDMYLELEGLLPPFYHVAYDIPNYVPWVHDVTK